MKYMDRYLSGDTIQVCEDLILLGQADCIEIFPEVEKVFAELFRRVRHNLEAIHEELEKVDYKFWQHQGLDFKKHLLLPVPEDELQKALEKLEAKNRFMPLSLQYFYKYVGACNFSWDYENYPDILWEYSDPIQISPLNDVVGEFIDEVIGDYEDEEVRQYFIEDFGNIDKFFDEYGLNISADYFHKDNISGGKPYSVQTTDKPCLDSLLLHEEHGTTFINYLRVCFDGCGFSRAYVLDSNKTFVEFSKRVKPRLLKI